MKSVRRYCLDKHSVKCWTFTVTLTLNTAKQSFQKTLQLMNMYCQTKLAAKRTAVLNICLTLTVMTWLYEPKLSSCDLDLNDSNSLFDRQPMQVHLTVVLSDLAYVSLEQAVLHSSEPSATNLSQCLFCRQTSQDRVAAVKAGSYVSNKSCRNAI